MRVGRLAGGAWIVAVERPHREHSQPLGPGERLKAIGVLQREHLCVHVVHAQHWRDPQLIPAERLPLAGEEGGHLRERRPRGIDGIFAHRLECWRRGAVAVIHRHHIDAVDFHARSEGDLDGVHAVLREPLRQHRQREPDSQARVALLDNRDCIHLELEGLGFGDGGPFDIEVKLVELQRVDHLRIGRCQGWSGQPPLGIGLRQALPRSPTQRHHHIAADEPQGIDFIADCHSLFVGAVERQDIVATPGELAAGAGLHEAERQ